MAQVSRPLIALLVATAAFFALWVVALKPHGSSGGSGGGAKAGLGQYQADINAAHHAVHTRDAGGHPPLEGPDVAETGRLQDSATGRQTGAGRVRVLDRTPGTAPSGMPSGRTLCHHAQA